MHVAQCGCVGGVPGLSSMDRQAPTARWLSFAHQGLTEIPYAAILAHRAGLQVLDLSYNRLQEYPFS